MINHIYFIFPALGAPMLIEWVILSYYSQKKISIGLLFSFFYHFFIFYLVFNIFYSACYDCWEWLILFSYYWVILCAIFIKTWILKYFFHIPWKGVIISFILSLLSMAIYNYINWYTVQHSSYQVEVMFL